MILAQLKTVFFNTLRIIELKHDKLNDYFNKLFRQKWLVKFILYNVLINLIGTVAACIMFIFVKDSYAAAYILGTPFISYNISTIVMSGHIIYRNNFCRWSKLAHQGMLLYWLTFMVNKFVVKLHYSLHVVITTTLIIILLYALLYINKTHKYQKPNKS